jgi:hypothetical protein
VASPSRTRSQRSTVAPTLSLALGANSTNNGTIVVNSSGANNVTILSINNTFHHGSGTGSIVLNANAANLDSAYMYFNNGANVLTNGPSHTIRGTGNIYTNIANAGTIQADVSGATLQLQSQSKSNSGTMRAINGGTLAITGIGITQSGGQIVAASGTVSVIELHHHRWHGHLNGRHIPGRRHGHL